MVKLFVTNLPPNADPDHLRMLFTPLCKVNDIDVVKNYAFVHVDDEYVDDVIARTHGTVFHGNYIQVKLATSKLGPSTAKCGRCANTSHTTGNCPYDPRNYVQPTTIQLPLSNGSKRPMELTMTVQGMTSTTYGDYGPSVKRAALDQDYIDAEIQKPAQAELQSLYEDYVNSRKRYAYFKQKLLNELRHTGTATYENIATQLTAPEQCPPESSTKHSRPTTPTEEPPHDQSFGSPQPLKMTAEEVKKILTQ